MQRDTGLIAKILRFVETEGTPGRILSQPSIEGYDQPVVNYHVNLCAEAGFLRFQPAQGGRVDKSSILALTWQGHDFLESFRASEI